MDYQFINISMSARVVSAKATQRKVAGKSSGRSHWPISKIIDEAARIPAASQHVVNPLKPSLIYGLPLNELEVICYQTADNARFENGKKIRKDTPVVLTIVASFPRELQLKNQSSYEKWKKDTLNFIQTIYKSYLKTVVEHLDEEHPHLHFFILPKHGRAKDIHPGYLAERGVKDAKIKKQRHSDGLKDFQDSYWEKVGKPNCLSRIGPARRRVLRSKVLQEREYKKMIEETEIYCEALKSAAIAFIKENCDEKALELLRQKIENESQKNVRRSF